jgi:hypothetical protein
MNPRIAATSHEMRRLDDELEMEFARKRLELAFSVRERVVKFEERVLKHHKDLKVGLFRYVLGGRLVVALTAPAIYALIVPMV